MTVLTDRVALTVDYRCNECDARISESKIVTYEGGAVELVSPPQMPRPTQCDNCGGDE